MLQPSVLAKSVIPVVNSPESAVVETPPLPRLVTGTSIDPEADDVAEPEVPVEAPLPGKILAIDIGGTKFKMLASGQTEPRKASSGKKLTPTRLIEMVQELAGDWEYEAISIGYPGLVGPNGPRSEPGNLGSGWVGFDYAGAFGKPVRVVNDAAMQALGSYEGGRMLFLGLGTGLGSTLIADNVIVNLELGELPCNGEPFSSLLGRKGLERLGKKAWREVIARTVPALMTAFVADYVVLGGGNSKEIKQLPPGARRGHNLTAFRGGFLLWHLQDVPTLSGESGLPRLSSLPAEWRVL